MSTTIKGLSTNNLRQKHLAGRIAMQHTVLSTFLVIQDKLHSNSGFVRPVGVWRLTAITNQIARVIIVQMQSPYPSA
jgi:hypothetical protein